jgi:hypothetical protein
VGKEGHDPLWKPLFESYVTNDTHPTDVIDSIVHGLAVAGYTATTDFPSCFLLAELMERFPHAKIILSVRDTPQVWAESFRASVGTIMGQSTRKPFRSVFLHKMGPFADFLDQHLWRIIEYTDHGRRPTVKSLEQAYIRWIDHVQHSVPSDQLLIHNAKDGWTPLCLHLNISQDKCPTDIPYPRNNSRATWIIIVFVMCLIADYWPYILIVPSIALVGISLWCLYSWRRNNGLKTAVMPENTWKTKKA